MSTQVLATFHNAEDNVSGEVFESGLRQGGFGKHGKFAAALRDDDSGQVVGSVHGFHTFDEAAAEACRMAGVKNETAGA